MKTIFKSKIKYGIILVLVLSLTANVLNLLLPRVASDFINKIFQPNPDLNQFAYTYMGLVIAIFIASILQTIFANIFTEQFSAELREKLIHKISGLSYNKVTQVTSAKLLTNMTSDVEAVKALFNQVIVIAFSSIILIVGASISMLSIDWQLALIVMTVIPLLIITFMIIFKRVGKYFRIAQENLDRINKVINESIVGSALIRVLNSHNSESEKFGEINEFSRQTNLQVVNGFASLIPVVTILSNLAMLAVVYFGGSQVIDFIQSKGSSGLTPGDYSAFFTYIGTFIMPIMLLGFISNIIARSTASLKRIENTLALEDDFARGTTKKVFEGNVSFKNVSLEIDNRSILKDISFEIKAKSRNAIVGPTAAGKTQIFNLIAGLQEPTAGEILIDGINIRDFSSDTLYSQLGLVFQDSIIFNTTIRENLSFNKNVSEENMLKAIETAELKDFIDAQPEGLNTIISERGASLSGGQKQRLSLARALSLDPKILLLDDFTARVDIKTEQSILNNLKKNYPALTLLSISQKIESVKDYDQILLIMEGELLAKGTHQELLEKSFEYQQIFNSQKSTE